MISILVLIPFIAVIIFLFAIIYVLKPAHEVNEYHQEQIMVARYEDRAYWIINDQLYRAALLKDGNIDHSTEEAIDSMTINFDEMPLLFNILDALKQHGA